MWIYKDTYKTDKKFSTMLTTAYRLNINKATLNRLTCSYENCRAGKHDLAYCNRMT
jgi:hypothetical protein